MSLDEGYIYTWRDKLDILFKKIYGLASTGSDKDFYREDLSYKNNATVLPDQILTEGIPATAPAMEYTDAFAEANLINPIPGVTGFTHIVKYLKMEMEPIQYTENSFFLTELKNSIPFGYAPDLSYRGAVYLNDGTTEIPASFGSWFIDYDTGVLTFHNYDQIAPYLISGPPKITFFKYEGATGFPPEENPSTIIEIFDGGDDTGTADTLSSIIVDDRDFSTFAPSDFSRSINIGGYYDGSWRITVQGGGIGTPENTVLCIQKRLSGVWTNVQTYL